MALPPRPPARRCPLARGLAAALLSLALAACQAGPPAAPPPTTPAAGAAPAPPAASVALLWATDGAPATLDRPAALALGPGGELYVVDAGHARIAVFDRDGRFLRAWGGPGADAGQFRFLVSACPGGYHPEACAEAGGGVAVDERGRVYVADYGNHRVQVFDAAGRFLAAWGHAGGGPGELQLPGGIAVDGRGRVYVSDGGNRRVQVFDRDGRALGAWGGPGAGEGQFRRPGALAVDGQGRLAVADLGNGRVQLFDRDGRFLAAWPVTGDGGLGADGGRLAGGLAFDGQGGLTVGAAEVQVVQFDRDGLALRAWRADWLGQGRLGWPAGVAVDAAGDVYVADAGAGRVLKVRVLTPVTR